MRREDVQAELEHVPFHPIRLHLVSGKNLDIQHADEGWMLRRAILVMRRRSDGRRTYNVVALLNIERIERLADLP